METCLRFSQTTPIVASRGMALPIVDRKSRHDRLLSSRAIRVLLCEDLDTRRVQKIFAKVRGALESGDFRLNP